MTDDGARPSYGEPQLASLYQELILDHYKRPRNAGPLPGATAEIHMLNPTCGDEIRLRVRVEDDRVVAARFEGQGCSISQAAASMMTGLLQDRPVDEARALIARFKELMHGDAGAARDRTLGDLRALAGVSKFPVRVKCALLPFNALEDALGAGTPEREGSPGA